MLIANRGEIACRVARGCRVLGVGSVAVFSEADALARHVRLCDEAVCVGPAESTHSYLNIEALLRAAQRTGADAVHPGYGFLSENTDFARAVEKAGLTWIGPPADVIAPIQSKTAAKAIAQAAGVPTAPARVVEATDDRALREMGEAIGFPMLVKPQDGGGGKGMQRVDRADQLPAALASARRVAASAFKSDRLFVERFVDRARHVEVQVFGDRHGEVIHAFERDCTLQRRHQKVVEESPCPALTPQERERICESGRAFAAQIGYVGAGTVEFLFDPCSRQHFFLEMNTRLQVEHPATELVVGADLVVAQLRVARGERLADIWPGGLRQRGHAIEVRVYAEDPTAGYVPQVGRLLRAEWPDAPFVRTDAGFCAGDEVSMHYDPMLAKIIAWGRDRGEATARLQAALAETVVHGVGTNLGFLQQLLAHEAFVANDPSRSAAHTTWLDAAWGDRAPGTPDDADQTALAALAMGGSGGPLARTATSSATDRAARPADVWQCLDGFRVGGEAE
ncbi:MAG: ATP-grasp domain-containing protein [Deltaproteobacteria bacterium]|nr:ATP-grasp domain-containing protein [Deltaproteobacteria bacterium]